MSNLTVKKINGSDVEKGVATLDDNGQVPLEQINSAILKAMLWRGVWDSEANSPFLESSVGRSGDFYAVGNPSEGVTNLDGITTFNSGDLLLFNGTIWQVIRDRNTVLSVCGKVGVVVLDRSDVGLSQVDNTSDVNKPISNSVYNALTSKVDVVPGKALSDNNYTDDERTKLSLLNNFSGKGSDVTLETSSFNNNLNSSVNTAQKLAIAVDNLPRGSTGGFRCGDVKYTLTTDIEEGWYELDGRTIYKDTDFGLWTLFGNTDTSGTLPDCRGRFIRTCNDSGSGPNPYRSIGTMQTDTIQGHGHQMNAKLDNRASGGAREFWSADGSALSRSREREFESLMQPTSITSWGDVRVSNETRPINIAMRLIIKR